MKPMSKNMGDLTWLARRWERLVASIEYPTISFCIEALLLLVESHLRGKGMPTSGSPEGHLLMAQYCLEVARRAYEDPHRGVSFPTLERLGITSLGGASAAISRARQVIRERSLSSS